MEYKYFIVSKVKLKKHYFMDYLHIFNYINHIFVKVFLLKDTLKTNTTTMKIY